MRRVMLAVLTGVLLGFAFPPFEFGVLACVGLVPLLVVLDDMKSIPQALRFTYLAMLIFHGITLNWTGGYAHMKDVYMMIAGALTITVHPLFYFVPIGLYLLVRNRFGAVVAMLAFPILWVGYEYSHSLSEWSFPWLTLGNTQSYDLERIQIGCVTGIYGLSLWLAVLNVLVFSIVRRLGREKTPRCDGPTLAGTVAVAVLYILPWGYGKYVLSSATVDGTHPAMDEGEVTVGMIQSNADPWEKWTTHGGAMIDGYIRATEGLVVAPQSPRPQIVLWPETAMPYFILAPQNQRLLSTIRARLNPLHVAVLTGTPHFVEYEDLSAAPHSAKTDPESGRRYDTFNAAAFLQPGIDSVAWYGKMKMVPLAERIPYAEWFAGFDVLRWTVGMGGWQIGPGHVVFTDSASGAKFTTSICYESVYPDFVAEGVRRGAEFLSIITVDSWWDHMSGAYQHERFAIFRAVENRRWIARCAIGGISCYIDPYGRTYDATGLLTKAALSRTIGRSAELTFYTKHGEIIGTSCLWLAIAVMVLAIAAPLFMKGRTYRDRSA